MVTTRPLVIIGLPTVGKSSVGRLVASELGRPFVDLDERIVQTAGRSIADVFATDGEPQFRALETEALQAALAEPGSPVIAGGGGIVVTADNRRLLADRALVVWLDVAVSALAARLNPDLTRPLLNGDPVERLVQLHRDRLGLYATSADVVVNDDGRRDVAAMADRVVELISVDRPEGPIIEHFDFGDDRTYPVVVGRGAVDRLASLLPDGVRRVAIVTQEGIGIDVEPGVEHQVFTVADGEEAKQLDVVGRLASRFAQWGFTRRDAVISVGGGVVSDVAGYLAASYHRGVPVLHVSTTLLGQIDAALGGKCGVNLPEGKNLLGAFKQPVAVICDTDTLATLPPAEFISGMGELAKYHFLVDPAGGDVPLDELPLPDRVAACVRIKADVVVDDEREGGRRAILNYGHTLAHALEIATAHELRHGEAVAIGLIYAAELAHRLGRIDAERVAEHRRVVTGYGLETTIPAGLDADELVELFSRDKKALDGITFVLDGPDGVEPVVVEDRALLLSTMDAVR